MKRNNLLLAVMLCIGFGVTLIINWAAVALPLFGRGTGEISDSLPNLFVPAGITFSVWSVIYLALTVFTVYQLVVVYRSPENPPAWWRTIAPWVLASHIANSLWIFAWHALLLELSVLIMVVLFVSLVRIATALQWSDRILLPAQFWAVSLPFSLYVGWITVALPANITGLLVSWDITDLAPGPMFWAALLACAAAGLAVIMIQRHGDAAYALVISWALLGIALARISTEEWLSGWAAGLSALVCIAALLEIITRVKLHMVKSKP
ncbi:MAG: hypothetical protein ACOCVC_08060 [Spirochaeta sp.]